MSMKKQKHERERRTKNSLSRQGEKIDITELMPMDLAGYVSLAEKDALPLILEHHSDAKVSLLLLAQYTYFLVMKESPIPAERVSPIVHLLLGLWKAGFYMPGPQYPYTFQETLQRLQKGQEKEKDYSHCVQAFSSSTRTSSRDLGHLFAGIVKNPETDLWQVWIQGGTAIAFFGTYSQPEEAQNHLEVLVQRRRGDRLTPEQEERWNTICAHSAEGSEMLPDDVLKFVLKHYQDYRIEV